MPLTLDGTNGVSAVQAGAVESGDLAAGAIGSNDLPAGSVIQVVSTTKTDTLTASLNADSLTTVSGLSASLTPLSSSSKVLVHVQITMSKASSQGYMAILQRNGSDITGATGDSDGSRRRATAFGGAETSSDSRTGDIINIHYLDEPSTASNVFYGVRIGHTGNNSRTIFVNRTSSDGNALEAPRAVSTITLMEIAG